MKRRTMLATLLAGASAGCVSRAATDSGTDGSATMEGNASTTTGGGSNATRTPDGEYPAVRVRSAPPASEEAVALTGTVVQQFSPTHPAIVRLRLSNRSDTEQRVSYRPRLPLAPGSVPRRDGDERIHFLPADGEQIAEQWSRDATIPDAPTNGCWTLPYDYIVRTKGATSLAPGETVEREYVVLDGRTEEACLVAGTYAVTEGGEQYRPEYETGFAVVLGAGDTSTATETDTTTAAGDTTARTDTGNAAGANDTDSATETTDRDGSATSGGNGKAKQER